MVLVKIANKYTPLPSEPMHGFLVDSPGARGLLQINMEGIVIGTIPPFQHFVGKHWKEVEIYCKHVRGYSCRWINDI
jgi:hypothetical protein